MIELDITGIINPPVWLEDETEYDIERIRRSRSLRLRYPQTRGAKTETLTRFWLSGDRFSNAVVGKKIAERFKKKIYHQLNPFKVDPLKTWSGVFTFDFFRYNQMFYCCDRFIFSLKRH